MFFCYLVENEMEKCQIHQRYRKASEHCYAVDSRV